MPTTMSQRLQRLIRHPAPFKGLGTAASRQLRAARHAVLAPYTCQAVGMYKCTRDKSTTLVGTTTFPRVRSYSMNAAVGTLGGSNRYQSGDPVWGPWLDGSGHHTPNHPWRTYGKVADMISPKPAGLWVFLDEEEKSIDVGSFDVCMTATPTGMVDWPGIYHNFGANFSLADGHAESHKLRA